MENETSEYQAFKAKQRKTRIKIAASIAGAILAVAIGWGALLSRPIAETPRASMPVARETPRAPETPAPADRTAPAAADARTAPPPSAAARAPSAPAPAAAPTTDATTDLAKALSSDNAGVRINALRAVRDGGSVEVLPQLLALDLTKDPEAAPTLVATVAQLAKRADPAQRSAAAGRMRGWLQSELARADKNTDARGNLSVLVEALGTLPSQESTAALSEALDSPQLPVHVATVAVQSLAQLGDPAARGAVQRFRDRLAQAPQASGFARELQDEAAQAADQALARLDH